MTATELLPSVNRAIGLYYQEEPRFGRELSAVADDYIDKQRGIEVSRVKVDWGEAPDVSIFYGRESDLGSQHDSGTSRQGSAPMRSPRPYERMNITGVTGLTTAQKASLRALGAVQR